MLKSVSTVLILFCIVYFSFTFLVFSAEAGAGRGFGDHYLWHSLEVGKRTAREQQKPLMVIIHKSWCGACKSLKPVIEKSESIHELSKDFVMVNLEDKEEPMDSQFKPDGAYIPRIFFLNPSTGEVDPSIYNQQGSTKYKYFYSSEAAILESMKEAKEKFSKV